MHITTSSHLLLAKLSFLVTPDIKKVGKNASLAGQSLPRNNSVLRKTEHFFDRQLAILAILARYPHYVNEKTTI